MFGVAMVMCHYHQHVQIAVTGKGPGCNAAYPNSKALRTGTRRPNAEWSSQMKLAGLVTEITCEADAVQAHVLR